MIIVRIDLGQVRTIGKFSDRFKRSQLRSCQELSVLCFRLFCHAITENPRVHQQHVAWLQVLCHAVGNRLFTLSIRTQVNG